MPYVKTFRFWETLADYYIDTTNPLTTMTGKDGWIEECMLVSPTDCVWVHGWDIALAMFSSGLRK